jgi:hypothetical protein
MATATNSMAHRYTSSFLKLSMHGCRPAPRAVAFVAVAVNDQVNDNDHDQVNDHAASST